MRGLVEHAEFDVDEHAGVGGEPWRKPGGDLEVKVVCIHPVACVPVTASWERRAAETWGPDAHLLCVCVFHSYPYGMPLYYSSYGHLLPSCVPRKCRQLYKKALVLRTIR